MAIEPTPRRCSGEEGVSLLIALAFLAAFGLWIGTILTLTTANEHGTTVIRSQRSVTYSADSAVSGALQWIRNDPTLCTTISPYSFSDGTTTTTVTASCITSLGTRFVNLTATSGTIQRLTAVAVIFDSDGTAGSQPVKILKWRTTG